MGEKKAFNSWSTCLCFALVAVGCGGSGGDAEPVLTANAEQMEMVEERLAALAPQFVNFEMSDEREVFDVLRTHLEDTPDVYGAAFAFVPLAQEGELVKSSPYVFRAGAGLVERNLAESYDYVSEQWYAEPVEAEMAVWSDPYFDEGGGDIWMVTYSIPLYDNDSLLTGVLTSDLPVEPE